MATKSLYVGNLPYTTTENDLRELFSAFSPADVRLIPDKGFGFVDVPEEQVADAIAATNGKDIGGRSVIVSEARPRTERGTGGGMGGGRRGGGGGGGGGRRW